MSRIPQIFVKEDCTGRKLPWEVKLSEDDRHHLLHVLRLKRGSEVNIIDRSGNCFKGELIHLQELRARASREIPVDRSSDRFRSVLFVSPPRAGKMDDLVKPLAELGVDEMTALFSENTVVKQSKWDWPKKKERWQRLVRESAKQSGRLKSLDFGEPLHFDQACQWLDQLDLGFICVLPAQSKGVHHPFGHLSHGKWPIPVPRVGFMIGPEGGFTAQEIRKAVEKGWIPLHLTPYVLRVETAAIAAMAVFHNMIFSWHELQGVRA